MSKDNNIYEKLTERRKSLAVLIDPDKFTSQDDLMHLIRLGVECKLAYFFVGGSLITQDYQRQIIKIIKEHCSIPVILFPSSAMHVDATADAILFLSMISGRNPDLLIGQQVVAAPLLAKSDIEVISTGYMLIDGGKPTSVSYMSNTTPIPHNKPPIAVATAQAGELLGLRAIYMDAGSGATQPVSETMVSQVRKSVNVPLIVGGGMDTSAKAESALGAGADTIVIGNAIEKDPNLLIEVSECIQEMNRSLFDVY